MQRRATAAGTRNRPSWLLNHEEAIGELLLQMADQMPVGSDPGDWPIQRSRALPDKTRVTVAFSAVRRLEARQLADILRDLAGTWGQRVQALATLPAA